MTIYYWTGFSKRKNSTKTPTAGTSVTAYLKEDTTILNPSIDSATIPANANYMYIADFGRYYFVRNVTKVGASRNLFELEVDPMASYKSSIGSTNCMIEYCADSTNIYLTDPRNKPQQTFYETQTTLLDLTANQFSNSGKYIVGIAGGPGGVTYYIMDANDLQTFYDDVYTTSWSTQLDPDYWNVKEAIVSCRWIPYSPAQTLNTTITIGSWVSSVSVPMVANRIKTISDASYNITFPSDSLIGAGYGTNYLDMAPFSTGTLYLPFVGVVPLDLDVVSMSKQIRISAAIDNYTNDIVYRVGNDSGDYINSYQGNCGVDIPIVAQQRNMLSATAGAISLIGGIGSGVSAWAAMGPAAGLTAGLVSGAASMAGLQQSIGVHTQVNGSMSSAVSGQLGLKAYASVMTRKPTVEDLTAFAASSGMPFFQVDTISNHSGYVQCYDASVAMTGTPQEKDTVNGYVNGGFFYE